MYADGQLLIESKLTARYIRLEIITFIMSFLFWFTHNLLKIAILPFTEIMFYHGSTSLIISQKEGKLYLHYLRNTPLLT